MYGNITAMWGAMHPEYTLRAMERTVVLKYPRYKFAELAKLTQRGGTMSVGLELTQKVRRSCSLSLSFFLVPFFRSLSSIVHTHTRTHTYTHTFAHTHAPHTTGTAEPLVAREQSQQIACS